MRSVFVLVLFIVLIGSAIWFVWMNRASEKIVSSTVPIAVAAIVGVFLAGWVFGGEADYEVTFPVCYMLNLETKLPLDSVDEMNRLPTRHVRLFQSHRFWSGTSPVLELKMQRPDLFADTTKNNFFRNIYHHLLQRSLIDFWAMLYGGSWKVADPLVLHVGSIQLGKYGGTSAGGNTSKQTVLETANLQNILKDNWFSRIPQGSFRLCLPPNSTVTVRVPPGGTDANGKGEIRISNRFCTITITTEVVLPIRTIGAYRVMAELTQDQATHLATNMYTLRAHIQYEKWLSGHPEMKDYKQWATQLVSSTKNQFDEQHIWAQVKEDDLWSHIHPSQ